MLSPEVTIEEKRQFLKYAVEVGKAAMALQAAVPIELPTPSSIPSRPAVPPRAALTSRPLPPIPTQVPETHSRSSPGIEADHSSISRNSLPAPADYEESDYTDSVTCDKAAPPALADYDESAPTSHTPLGSMPLSPYLSAAIERMHNKRGSVFVAMPPRGTCIHSCRPVGLVR